MGIVTMVTFLTPITPAESMPSVILCSLFLGAMLGFLGQAVYFSFAALCICIFEGLWHSAINAYTQATTPELRQLSKRITHLTCAKRKAERLVTRHKDDLSPRLGHALKDVTAELTKATNNHGALLEQKAKANTQKLIETLQMPARYLSRKSEEQNAIARQRIQEQEAECLGEAQQVLAEARGESNDLASTPIPANALEANTATLPVVSHRG